MDVSTTYPPEEMVYTGRGNFQATGRNFLGYFKNLCGLQPHHRVLEVGSGIGRMAIPLTQYLNSSGSYDGLEIVDVGVRWCQEEITPHYPNFRFRWADVYNQGYNPDGKYEPEQFVLPYPSNSFDFVFLTSVFTHMMRNELDNYLYEVARVMKLQGRCLITYFLHDNETADLIASGQSHYGFGAYTEHCYIANPALPEDVVGYDWSYINSLYTRFHLEVEYKYPGSWRGRPCPIEPQSCQDIVVARKVSNMDPIGTLRHLSLRKRWWWAKTWRRLFHEKPTPNHGLINQVVEEARRSEHRLAS